MGNKNYNNYRANFYTNLICIKQHSKNAKPPKNLEMQQFELFQVLKTEIPIYLYIMLTTKISKFI